MAYLNQSSGLDGLFDTLGSVLQQRAAQQKQLDQQQALSTIALASLPGGPGLASLPASQPASSSGFFDKLFGGLGGGSQPAQPAPAAASAVPGGVFNGPYPQASSPPASAAPQPAASPSGGIFGQLFGMGSPQSAPTPGQASPVAWDKSRDSARMFSAPQFAQPAPTPQAVPSAPAQQRDVPLPPQRPVDMTPTGSTAAPAPAPVAALPDRLPTFAASAPVAAPPQPDSPPNDVPMYGRSSAGALPTFAALQGAPTSRVTPNNASGLFSGVEQQFNLPPGYLAQTYQIESGGNPNAYNKGSGAAGGFQFIPSTARAVGLSNPYDLTQSTYAAGKLAAGNANVLRQALGRDPTAGELYLAHQQGAAGAAKLLTNPDAPAASIVGASAVKSNGGSAGMSAGQFASLWTSRFGAPGPIGAAPSSAGPSMGPYGGLDPNAFGGGAGNGLPMMAAMGMPLTRATAFAPSAPVITQDAPIGGDVAFSASGQPVRTDAKGNALGADGRPTALAYGGTVNGASAAPASRAIAAAAPDGDPLVTVPGYPGQWNRARIAAAPDGTDVPDDGELARAQGGGAPFSSDAPVQVPRRGSGTAVAGSPAAPVTQAPSQPSAATMPQAASGSVSGSGVTTQLLQALLTSPDPGVKALGLQLWQRQLLEKPEQHAYKPGDYVVDGNGRMLFQVPDKPEVTDAIKNYQFSRTPAGAGFSDYQQGLQKSDKAQLVEVPLADGRMQKAWAIPGQVPTPDNFVGQPYVPKPGTAVSIDQKAESSQEGEYGKAVGQQLGEVMKAGSTAPQALNQVAMLRAAAARAGDNLSTGPFGPIALKAKQSIGNILGVEIPGTSEGEVINNIGYGLATQAARAISNRPTQMEFANALSVKPGLSLSPQGMTAVLNIREQDLKDQIALAKLASVKSNRDNWADTVSNYYDTHPVMSPFDPSRPLGAQDVQAINGSQQQSAPSSISTRDASALPTVRSPADAARLPPGTMFKTPDGRIKQR